MPRQTAESEWNPSMLQDPKSRMSFVTRPIHMAIPQIQGVLWCGVFGSFFDDNIRHQPHDIDIILLLENREGSEAKTILGRELKKIGIPPHIFLIDPYNIKTKSASDMAFMRTCLINVRSIYGTKPNWLS